MSWTLITIEFTPFALNSCGTELSLSRPHLSPKHPLSLRYHDKTHSPLPAPVPRGFVLADSVRIVDELAAFDFVQLLRSVNAFDEKVGPVAAHLACFGDAPSGRL